MKTLSRSILPRVRFARSLALTALMGATMLASPMAARADTVALAAFQLAQATTAPSKAGAGATQMKTETVEQRITSLHAALKITADEDVKWNAVAQTMRDNATSMDKLIAENEAKAPQGMSAVDDLMMYQKFSQAHVDGLKSLIASFSALYSAMPDAQRKIADTVFAAAHDQRAVAHS